MKTKKAFALWSLAASSLLISACSTTGQHSYDPRLPQSCRVMVDFMTEPSLMQAAGDKVPAELVGIDRRAQQKLLEQKFISENKTAEECDETMSLNQDALTAHIDSLVPQICLQYRASFQEKMSATLMDESKMFNMLKEKDKELYFLKSVKGEKTLKAYCDYAASVWQKEGNLSKDDYLKGKADYPLSQACEIGLEEFETVMFIEKENLSFNEAFVLGRMRSSGLLPIAMVKRAYWNYFYGSDTDGMAKECQDMMK
ncbi:hypothetical protein [Leminorella grimontii]|uniref:hypothetical protein n=1 Tax=Leminorella grimontii TaxID=82981 RepID=UPI002081FBB0|nr:hypothetical protein [Leminorella grimontii]GKX57804.1 hypothetical protein SOASR031_01190 [Leminorella grimontii]